MQLKELLDAPNGNTVEKVKVYFPFLKAARSVKTYKT